MADDAVVEVVVEVVVVPGFVLVVGGVLVVVVVVGVPDKVGASVGVMGAVLGMFDGDSSPDSADMDFHSSQSTAQSQMSPSA
mgnify:CR=1 FL=1